MSNIPFTSNRPAESHEPLPAPSTQPVTSTPLSLSLSIDPIPAKLAQKVRAGHFVEMREFLGDNIALTEHFESFNAAFPSHVLPSSSRPRLREVTTLPSWIHCFLTFMAIATSDPATRDQLIYARLLVREALRHGGRGWLDYDRLFRQQVAIDPTLQWDHLHPSLVSSTIFGHRSGNGTFCRTCRGSDHTSSQCAMTYIQQPVRERQPPFSHQQRVPQNVCWSWNSGRCGAFPAPCTRVHACATCGSPQHPARSCKDTPADSRFRRPAPDRGGSSSNP